MKIGIIDADLIGRKRHRFPNLACEKISGYWKDRGADVQLLLDFFLPSDFDHIYISKVFTDTPTPPLPTDDPRVHIGGTGFFFDQAPNLPDEIEHHMPDYHLYDRWIFEELQAAEYIATKQGKPLDKARFMSQFKEYTDYSIGFVTRGCFRQCKFCVNQKYKRVFVHSPLSEFFDPSRKKICLLDDNFLGFSDWQRILDEILSTKKPLKFKQGLDERLLTEKKCQVLFSAKYDGDFTFAFDNIEDYQEIEEKLKLIRQHSSSTSIKFYVLVGFKSTDHIDIEEAFARIELLMRYRCLPYVMRYQSPDCAPWKESKYRELYVAMARWCNQPGFFKKKSFREFCLANQAVHKSPRLCSCMRALLAFEKEYPEISKKYFDLKYENYPMVSKE